MYPKTDSIFTPVLRHRTLVPYVPLRKNRSESGSVVGTYIAFPKHNLKGLFPK